MWDYYFDKLLQNLVLEYEFDFEKIAGFLNRNNSTEFFTEESCRKRYTMNQK